MRIVFFTDFYHPSVEGVTASIDLFASALRSHGHRVWIVAPAPAKPIPNEHEDIIRLPSIPSVWYHGGNLRDSILTPYYGQLVRELRPDIFHFHSLGTTGLAGMRLMHDMHIPSVAQYHTDMEQYAKIYRGMWIGMLVSNLVGPLMINKPDAWPDTLSGMKPKRSLKEWNQTMIRNLIRVCYENFNEIIAPSEKMSDFLQSYGVTRPITILPTGINPAEFPEMTKPKPKNKTIELLYVGRIAREKNIDLLIDMMVLLKRRVPGKVRLTLVGPGTYLATVRKHAAAKGVVKLIDFQGGLPRGEALAAYGQADVFVFPSMTDTQALVLNEAAQCGLPLLFSDPDISHIAQADKTGLLLTPTPAAYAEAVIQLIEQPKLRIALGTTAQKLAGRYTSDAQAGKLELIYERVLKNV